MTTKRITRERHLSAAEAAKYDDVRRRVASEKPRILQRMRMHQQMQRLLTELRAAREEAGLSLADMRDRTGIDRAALSKLEGGVRDNPTLQTLLRYAAAVGKSLTLVDEK